MIRIKKNNEMKRMEIAMSGDEVLGLIPDSVRELIDERIDTETDESMKQEINAFEKGVIEMYITDNRAVVGFPDNEMIANRLLEINELLGADADLSNIIYHAKGEIEHLIEDIDRPINRGTEEGKKKRAELIANRPNLEPPSKRSAKPSRCVR